MENMEFLEFITVFFQGDVYIPRHDMEIIHLYLIEWNNHIRARRVSNMLGRYKYVTLENCRHNVAFERTVTPTIDGQLPTDAED